MAMQISGVGPALSAASPGARTPAPARGQTVGFGEMLSRALARVEQEQLDAQQAVRALAAGQVQDVARVMIAAEQANLSLAVTIQVRNKALEAYQELMRMPV